MPSDECLDALYIYIEENIPPPWPKNTNYPDHQRYELPEFCPRCGRRSDPVFPDPEDGWCPVLDEARQTKGPKRRIFYGPLRPGIDEWESMRGDLRKSVPPPPWDGLSGIIAYRG